jgi:hypothetical protein
MRVTTEFSVVGYISVFVCVHMHIHKQKGAYIYRKKVERET